MAGNHCCNEKRLSYCLNQTDCRGSANGVASKVILSFVCPLSIVDSSPLRMSTDAEERFVADMRRTENCKRDKKARACMHACGSTWFVLESRLSITGAAMLMFFDMKYVWRSFFMKYFSARLLRAYLRWATEIFVN